MSKSGCWTCTQYVDVVWNTRVPGAGDNSEQRTQQGGRLVGAWHTRLWDACRVSALCWCFDAVTINIWFLLFLFFLSFSALFSSPRSGLAAQIQLRHLGSVVEANVVVFECTIMLRCSRLLNSMWLLLHFISEEAFSHAKRRASYGFVVLWPNTIGSLGMRLRNMRGHYYELPAVKYVFNKLNFIVRYIYSHLISHMSVRLLLHHHCHHPLLLLTPDSKLIFSINLFLHSSSTFPPTGLTPRTPAVFRFSRACRF